MKQHVDPAGVDILAAWANTPLALVHETLKKGDFAPGPKKPVAENEEVLGELTPLEKAIYKATEEIRAANEAVIDEAMRKGEKPDKLIIHQNRTNHEALSQLLWACIQHRLGVYEANYLGFREGYKIVSGSSQGRAGIQTEVILIADPFMILASSMMADMAGKKDK